MIAILMGVMGSGKTTVAKELQVLTGWEYAEGDNYHSDANKAKMRAGIPLTDADRQPWLESLHAVLRGWEDAGKSGIMTCSALKQTYRDTLVGGLPAGSLRFVLLDVPKEELARRLASRTGHYMNPGLLDSQLATLEEPKDALRVDATGAEPEIARHVLAALNGK
ncbi:gluconokinase [Silvibacterium dinghuense]|uniref:Gluconokinase n=1 Tax=Silvibacterium dinghuense TaxID=1560006 RepID=A0A4Q1SDK6_9BACT|nr:gluconokinase [Silvibacterium dinghuense]RXS94988.1 gluconokinase [Silvibacterium dinghuense]GGH09642.1 gluconokinase [Silvibacterium dinghuense]